MCQNMRFRPISLPNDCLMFYCSEYQTFDKVEITNDSMTAIPLVVTGASTPGNSYFPIMPESVCRSAYSNLVVAFISMWTVTWCLSHLLRAQILSMLLKTPIVGVNNDPSGTDAPYTCDGDGAVHDALVFGFDVRRFNPGRTSTCRRDLGSGHGRSKVGHGLRCQGKAA